MQWNLLEHTIHSASHCEGQFRVSSWKPWHPGSTFHAVCMVQMVPTRVLSRFCPLLVKMLCGITLDWDADDCGLHSDWLAVLPDDHMTLRPLTSLATLAFHFISLHFTKPGEVSISEAVFSDWPVYRMKTWWCWRLHDLTELTPTVVSSERQQCLFVLCCCGSRKWVSAGSHSICSSCKKALTGPGSSSSESI